jgi:hypothetical protein
MCAGNPNLSQQILHPFLVVAAAPIPNSLSPFGPAAPPATAPAFHRSSCSPATARALQLLQRSSAPAAHRPPLGRSAAPGPWRSRRPALQLQATRRPGPRRYSSSSSCSTARALGRSSSQHGSAALRACPTRPHPGGQVASHPDIQAQAAATPSSKHQGIIYLFVLSN